ncbi:transposase [Streptomyces turgidiscabies]|uniref:Transposase n=1 Tax=Streptomyces turgidiscabies TaxID=85558 RepID=A0ABU0RJM7_9ACTN|nr:transposase [Streptomyces turgidiscabies]MDQ0932199.1 transposase [Streptomyces turgidiscabies]
MHRILLVELNAAGELDWSRACVDGSHIRAKKGGGDTGPSPVDLRKTGSKHHLICDGRGTPLKVITTAANVNDITQTLALIDGIPSLAGRPGRPRRRPASLLGDKGYDSNPNREGLRRRRILPVISRKGAPNVYRTCRGGRYLVSAKPVVTARRACCSSWLRVANADQQTSTLLQVLLVLFRFWIMVSEGG